MRMKYLLPALLAIGQMSYGQGSQINNVVQTFPGGYYGVCGQLTFNKGYIVTPRSAPTSSSTYFTSGSTHAGSTDSSHVNGYAEREGATAFVFPVGDGTKLRTAAISAPLSSSRFQAAYWAVNPSAATLPSGAPFPVSNLATDVIAVSTKEYWDVNGTLPVNITLSWNAQSDLAILTANDLSKLVVSGYSVANNRWENLGSAGTTGTLATDGSITAENVTPNLYSAFTFAVGRSSAIPDLTPTTDIDALAFSLAGQPRDFVVNIYEINNIAATGSISLRINKLSAFTITYPTASGISNVLGGTANQNSNWTFNENAIFITATAKPGVTIPANGQATLGFTISRNASVPPGTKQNITPTIVGGSGGETKTDNNSVVTTVNAPAL